MSIPTRPAGHREVTPAQVVIPAARHARRGVVLLVLALFQFWLWGTRIVNLLGEVDSFSAAFVAVHLVLYVAAIGAGVVLGVLGLRMVRETPGGLRAAMTRVPR